MKLVTYRVQTANEGRLGAIVGDLVVDLKRFGEHVGVAIPGDMLSFIDLGLYAAKAVGRLLKEHEDKYPIDTVVALDNVKLLAPIPRPRKNVFGIGLNYAEHVEESSRTLDTSKELPKEPVVFTKPPSAVIGPDEAIQHNPQMTQQLDWEVELAVVIGKKATRVSTESAMDYVFGYTIVNDVSARDNRRSGQWVFSKGQDTYCPMGPVIVTADELTDPHNLNLGLTVNGVEKQNSNTRHLLFNIPALIADISSGMTLEPGDVIATGTPQGVGAGRIPQEWLWAGDVVEAWVEGIGSLRNPIVTVGNSPQKEAKN